MGSLAASLAKDYLVADDLQTVTYTTEDGGTSVNLTGCDAHELTSADRAVLQGLFRAGDRVWYLPADQLAAAGITPKAGAALLDADGTAWAVTGDCVKDEAGIAWEAPATKAR